MKLQTKAKKRVELVAEFDRQQDRRDGAQVVTSLISGLSVLRHLLVHRLHEDVQQEFGHDSMLIPVSEGKTVKLTSVEVEIFQVAVSSLAAREFGYAGPDDDWYLPWLTRLRLGRVHAEPSVQRRLQQYLKLPDDQRRLAFTDVLAHAMPESRRTPLVLFQLFPWSVRIATALAFGDPARAGQQRQRQLEILPVIGGCSQCQGGLLENGRKCSHCGNPVWTFDWLKSAE